MSEPRVVSAVHSSIGANEVQTLLADSQIARTLSPEQLARFIEVARVATLPPDHVVLAEGDEARDFFIMLDGEVRITTRSTASGRPFELATLGPGQSFGEAALFGRDVRRATATTTRLSRILVIDADTLRESSTPEDPVGPFLMSLVQETSGRLAASNRMATEALERENAQIRLRNVVAEFLVWTIIVMSLYTISLSITLSVTDNLALASMSTNAIIVAMVFIMYRLARKSAQPRAHWGLVINPGWKREVVEALGLSAAMIGFIALLKYALIEGVPRFAGVPLLDSPFFGARPLGVVDVVFTVSYMLLAPVQELVTRGFLQTAFEDFFDQSRYRALLAIIVSNLMFATNHAHLDPWFAVMAFAPGLVWGAFYLRSRSLLAVGISHALVGGAALKIFGMDLLVRM